MFQSVLCYMDSQRSPPRTVQCEYTGCEKNAEVFWITPGRKKPLAFCPRHSKLLSLPPMARSISIEDIILDDVMDS